MREWVLTQNLFDSVNLFKMRIYITKLWFTDYCSYCYVFSYRIYCRKCPLTINGIYSTCCNGLRHKMDNTKTWFEWLQAQEKVVEYIKENGLKYGNKF